MTIQPINNKPENLNLATKSQAKAATSENLDSASTQAKDKVEIAAATQKIIQAFESSNTSQVINEDRVNAVKQALADGTYPINAERIAQKMIQMEQEQFNDSR